MMNCSTRMCQNTPRWRPSLFVWAKGYSKKKTDPAKIAFQNVILCDECKQKFAIVEAMPQAQWQNVVMLFRQNGMADPDMRQAEVRWDFMGRV